MATRLYLTGATSPYNPSSIRGGWANASGAGVYALPTNKLRTDAVQTLSRSWASGEQLFGQWVSLPVATETEIGGGTLTAYLRVREANAADNIYTYVAMWVVDSGGSFVEDLLVMGYHGAGSFGDGTHEWPVHASTLTNRTAISVVTPTATLAAGSRIVVEVGGDIIGSTASGAMSIGTATGNGTTYSDLPANETNTSVGAPWLEFSEDIPFDDNIGDLFVLALPVPTLSATGTVEEPIVEGAFASSLPVPTLAATGTVEAPLVEGALAAELPVPTMEAWGIVGIGAAPPHGGAKLGTRFLGVGASFAALATDICQEGVDMTATATSITENPAARYDRSTPRTLAAIAEVDDASVGTLFAQDDGGGGLATRLSMAVGGVLEARVDGTLVGSLTLPDVAASLRDMLIGWISIANPDTTGASDAVLSWLVAHNQVTLESARAAFTHAIKPASTARASWGDDDGAGTNAYSDGIVMAGMHDRRMTLRELVQDWGPLGAPAAPSTEFVQDRMPVPIDLSVGLHAVDELHGPAAAWAAHNHRQLRRRLATPLHVRYPATDPIERDSHLAGETHSSKLRLAVGSQTHRWHLGWLHCWPVPAGCDEAWVEVHAQQWQTVADRLAPISLRCYSINRPPGAIGGLNPGGLDPYEQYFVEATIERDDTEAGPGSHVTLGRLPLARATKGIRKGKTYIVLAYAIDPEETTGFEGFQQLRIHDLHVVPGFRDPVDGGLGFGGLGG